MKINEQCLTCLINQAIKTAILANADNREELYKKVFLKMSQIDFQMTNPEIAGDIFNLIKQHIGCDDPYQKTKKYYNQYFLDKYSEYDKKIQSFEDAVKYAVIANIIDFNPIHNDVNDNINSLFSHICELNFSINDTEKLKNDILNAKTILYLGDNCGEIIFDKLLIKRIKMLNPQCFVYFGVRGSAVVNDITTEDANMIKMYDYANVISNGDDSFGTVLSRTSQEFRNIFNNSDFVISKGQSNYESLNETEKKIYFLLVAKCKVIASSINVCEKSLVCMRNRNCKT